MIELICFMIIFLIIAFIGGAALVVGIQMSYDKDMDDGSHGIPAIIFGAILIAAVICCSGEAIKGIKYRIDHAAVCTGADCTDDIHKPRQYHSNDDRRYYPLILPSKHGPTIIPMFR